MLTVFEGDYELFDSLKIGHVLRSEDEIEVVVAAKNSTKVHAPQLTLPIVQEGLIKRPPEISHKLELNKPSVRKQSEQSNQSKVQRKQTEGDHFTNGTPMKATNQFESNHTPILDASFHEPMSTQANKLGESGQPKKKRGRPPKKTESPKTDAVKDNVEPMRQELVTDKIIYRMGDDEPISLAGDNLTHGAHTDINTHTEVTPLKEKAAEIKVEHSAQSIIEGKPQYNQEKHQTSNEKYQDTKQKSKDGLKKAQESSEQPIFSQEKPQSSQEEPHKIQNKGEAEQDIPQVSQDKNDEVKQEKKQKKKDKKKAERELAEAKKREEEEAEAERKLSMERQTRNKTAKNQVASQEMSLLVGSVDEGRILGWSWKRKDQYTWNYEWQRADDKAQKTENRLWR